MAVSAKFIADFSSFNAAVDKAETKLSEFRTESVKVESALRRMADSFSGKKILSDATLAVKAVQDLGGVSKLTTQEQQRLNATVTEAIAKYKALGQAAPQSLLDIEKATKKSTGVMSEMLGTLGKIGPAIGITFSIGAITGFAKSIGSFAGHMVDLQAQTKISTDRLQAFNLTGAGVGLTIDDIVTSADQLAKRVGGGDQSAVSALDKLGIKAYEFTQLNLDDAMLLIDQRMVGVTNQFERARLLTDLFGRSGQQMGRLMDGALREIIEQAEKSGGIIDKDLIKKADEFDDAWAQAWIKFKAGAVNAVGFAAQTIQGFIDISKRLSPGGGNVLSEANKRQLAEGAARETPSLPGRPNLSGFPSLAVPGVPADLKAIITQSDELAEKRKKDAKAAEEYKQAQEALFKSLKAFLSEANNNEGLKKMNQDIEAFYSTTSKSTQALQKLTLAATAPNVTSQLFPGRDLGASLIEGLTSLPAKIKSQGISNQIKKALFPTDFFEGLSGGFKSLLAGLTNGAGIGGFLGKVGTGIAEGFGNIISGGITSLIGKGIGLIGKGIGSLFGNKEGEKVNDLRDAAFAGAGGFDALNKKAAEAGVTLERVLSAKKIKDWESAWKDLQGTLNEFEADQERLNAAIEKYGFSIEELGPKLQKQELDSQAKELIEDWRVLVGAGIDVATVNGKMAESINQYLQTALKVGAEVPAAMKPILEAMAAQGTLVDENGVAITDLEKTGVKFSQTMTEGFDRVVKKLDELITKLQGAGQAISNIPSSINVDVNQNINRRFNEPEFDSYSLPGFAGGTKGKYLNFGSGTPVILHGKERVMKEGEGDTSLADMASAISSLDRRIAQAVTRGVTDALTLAPGWR